MRVLRVYKLTEEAEERGIDWSNFEESDLVTVDEIEIAYDDDREAEEIMHDAGYADSDMFGCECE